MEFICILIKVLKFKRKIKHGSVCRQLLSSPYRISVNNLKIKNENPLKCRWIVPDGDTRNTELLVTICSFICWRHQRSVPRGAQYVCTAHILGWGCIVWYQLIWGWKCFWEGDTKTAPNQKKTMTGLLSVTSLCLCGPGRARAESGRWGGQRHRDKESCSAVVIIFSSQLLLHHDYIVIVKQGNHKVC